jgi:hypothetical protein
MLSHMAFRLVALVAFLSLGLVGIAQAEDKAAAPATQASGVTGLWVWEQDGPGGSREIELDLKQDGETLTGTITGFGDELMDIEEGTVKDGEICFKTTREWGGRQVVTTYTATIEGQTLKGKQVTTIEGTFEGTKAQP